MIEGDGIMDDLWDCIHRDHPDMAVLLDVINNSTSNADFWKRLADQCGTWTVRHTWEELVRLMEYGFLERDAE